LRNEIPAALRLTLFLRSLMSVFVVFSMSLLADSFC
jgi:hypothetical protein